MTPAQLQQVLQDGARLHQSGRLAEALEAYRRVLAHEPRNADALHLTGMIDLAQGRTLDAVARMEEALSAAGPRPFPHYLSNLANALREAGRHAEAETRYRAAIAAGGATAEVWNNLGITLLALGRPPQAIAAFTESLRLRPDHAGTLSNLANAHAAAGEPEAALTHADAALSRAPGLLPALVTRAQALRALDRTSEACETAQSIVVLAPNDPASHLGLGAALAQANRHQEAVAAFEHAIALDPSSAIAFRNLSVSLVHLDQRDRAVSAAEQSVRLAPHIALNHAGLGAAELFRDNKPHAERAYRSALAIDPNLAEAWNGLGVAREKLGDDTEALACYSRAVALEPANAHARLNRAIMLLLRGDMPAGWHEYEWRLPWAAQNGGGRTGDAPRWRAGERMPDGSLPRVLIFTEQGLGDAVQFARFAPLVRAQASRVIVQANAVAAPLLRTVPGVDEVTLFGDAPPPHDRSIALMSIPAELNTTLDTIPRRVPYVFVPPDKQREWRERVHAPPGTAKIALAWSGSPLNQNDANRSIPLTQLTPLARVANARFYAVFKGPATRQIPSVLPWEVTDLSPYLSDLTDTAAALNEMDLLISVDTSVAHLGGALARPTWLLAFFPQDFRWLKDRTDSPWYPTMTIYRQKEQWQWEPIIEQVASDLEAFVRTRAP